MTTAPVAPMSLGDMFDRLFKLFASTWLRNLVIAAILILPSTLILGITAHIGFSGMAEALEEHGFGHHMSPDEVLSLFASFGGFFVGLFIYMVAALLATVGVTLIACSEMAGQPLSWQQALAQTFGVRSAKVFGMYILEGFAIGGLILIPYALIIGGFTSDSPLVGVVGILLLMAMIPIVTYLAVNFAFNVQAIVWEDQGVIESFRRSWVLVRGYWWRTFGILLLMSIIAGFAVSIVTTPLYFIVLWDFFRGYFEMLTAIGSGNEPDMSIVTGMIKSLGFGFGLLTGIVALLQLLINPLYPVVMYFDLRARKGEAAASPTTPALSSS